MAFITFQPNDYFNTKLYTGNASTNAITGVGFQPDWLWVKSRSRTDSHRLIDVLRGTNTWKTDSASAQSDASGDGFTSLDSDGFTLNGSGGGGEFNANSGTYAAWNWKAGGAGSSNSDGNITSTVSASTTAGFSIVTWTGTASAGTIGHGLGVAPKWVMVKNLDDAQAGTLSLTEVGWTKALDISSTGASNSSTSYWNDTAPSSSVVTLGSSNDTNGSGDSMIAYCFAEKPGFSKFGQYTGNGNATNPPFIYTGFKPAFVLTKADAATEAWTISDIARDNAVGSGNGTGARLQAHLNNTEDTNATWAAIHKYSNGFSPQHNDGVTNMDGRTYMYMAFAAEPLVSSNGIPATAR